MPLFPLVFSHPVCLETWCVAPERRRAGSRLLGDPGGAGAGPYKRQVGPQLLSRQLEREGAA